MISKPKYYKSNNIKLVRVSDDELIKRRCCFLSCTGNKNKKPPDLNRGALIVKSTINKT
jgi:hypothetical protein